MLLQFINNWIQLENHIFHQANLINFASFDCFEIWVIENYILRHKNSPISAFTFRENA